MAYLSIVEFVIIEYVLKMAYFEVEWVGIYKNMKHNKKWVKIFRKCPKCKFTQPLFLSRDKVLGDIAKQELKEHGK